jgi:hypothetical protein
MEHPVKVNGVRVPYSSTVSEIRAQLQHPGPEAWAACCALGHNPSQPAFDLLLELCNHRDWRYRRCAVEALSTHLLGGCATECIRKALHDPSPYVVRTACDSATALQLQEVHDDVLELLQSADASTREVAAAALKSLWVPSDFEAVFRVHKCDPSEQVRRAAAWTLRAGASAENWWQLFDSWLEDPIPRHRVWASELVGLFGDAVSKERLEPLRHDPNGHVRKAARRALEGV